jgi:hypothetical protein
MSLRTNAEGSPDRYLQKESPGKDKEANWLPAANARFSLTLRMYWPNDKAPSILDGIWEPPALRQVL